MQSVRQVVRQIKRSSHGRISRRTDEYEVSGSELCQAPRNNAIRKRLGNVSDI